MLLRADSSVLVVVDVQPTFLDGIWEKERVLDRTKFLVECANLLGVPVLTTVQYPERMGGTDASLDALIEGPTFSKMAFSCAGCQEFMQACLATGRKQAVLTGIETHICVTQTVADLLGAGVGVYLAADAVSARTQLAHEVGLKRMAGFGAQVTHTESAAYEWMGSAEHPSFREVLKLVKSYA